jgi:hypothetical protein
MGRFVAIHTVPGFSRAMLERTTDHVGRMGEARFVRAYASFAGGKVVCDWEAHDKQSVARTYAALGFAYDEIVAVEAICEAGEAGVDTRYLSGAGCDHGGLRPVTHRDWPPALPAWIGWPTAPGDNPR